jgi:beta-aspartyl-dipeptidase (metallo-type)
MLTIIENGEVYAPAPLGRQSLLLLGGTIAKVGAVDRSAAEALGVELEVVDASDCLICPGLIDPHEHLLGGSGEKGFSTMTPELFVEEIALAGVTTVVGCLGVDVTMKNMSGLVGKAKGLREEGIGTHLWTGGYRIPSTSLLQNVRDDILYVDEIIGVGEVAISDKRSADPEPRELAKVAHEAYVGGMLSRKCGLTHFHVGGENTRLAPLRELIEGYNVDPSWLYATHVERSEELMLEAIRLASSGAHVDIDVVEEDLSRWLKFYTHHNGDLARLTISSDASVARPRLLYEQLCNVVLRHKFALEQVLPLFTSNTARVLRLDRQGTIEPGKAADLLLLERGSLDIVHVRSRIGWLVRDGAVARRSSWLEDNKREFHLTGARARHQNEREGAKS